MHIHTSVACWSWYTSAYCNAISIIISYMAVTICKAFHNQYNISIVVVTIVTTTTTFQSSWSPADVDNDSPVSGSWFLSLGSWWVFRVDPETHEKHTCQWRIDGMLGYGASNPKGGLRQVSYISRRQVERDHGVVENKHRTFFGTCLESRFWCILCTS